MRLIEGRVILIFDTIVGVIGCAFSIASFIYNIVDKKK